MAAVRIKQKKFGPVYVQYEGSDILLYGADLASVDKVAPPTTSPVDTMLASLGACIVKSIEWVAGQKKTPLNPFTVEVAGIKAADLPNRVEALTVRVDIRALDDPETAKAVIKQAKSICTVSNSLNCDVALTVEPFDSAADGV
ncbi:MAG: OsmC family protein [Sneathiella sp.]